jgi:cell division protein FtsZ
MRMENAEWGLQRLRSTADTVIVIPNDKLIELYPRLGSTRPSRWPTRF